MPYFKETATGDSLIWLQNSKVLREFEDTIFVKRQAAPVQPPILQVARSDWTPSRVIAIDGSHLTHRVNNGLPGAEAGLVMISVVVIKLELLGKQSPGAILSPAFFRDMENVQTLESAMPGIGVTRINVENDTPIDFYRQKVYDTLLSSVGKDHETLLDTLHEICENDQFAPRISCPITDCERSYEYKQGEYYCSCSRKEKLFETDVFRLHEYFDDNRTSVEAISRLRSVLEVLILINILRFFAKHAPDYLKDCAFVLDGPLAIFGTTASILRPVRKEIKRISRIARKYNGKDIVLFGIEKTGRMNEHWEQLDYDDDRGPRSRFPDQTVIVPDHAYIQANIAPSNLSGKPFGQDTHFGRVVLYKTSRGKQIVVYTGMLNDSSSDFRSNSPECYPRLGDTLNVVDNLATYIYEDGFLPLIRAHAHAAIPLKRGTDIIKSLFEDK